MVDNSREALLRSMRNTLRMMEAMGVPKEKLVEVLELAAVEMRAELARRNAPSSDTQQ